MSMDFDDNVFISNMFGDILIRFLFIPDRLIEKYGQKGHCDTKASAQYTVCYLSGYRDLILHTI